MYERSLTNSLWVEKYRPRTIEETILPENLKTTFGNIARSGDIPNMLFVGTAGLGKTTVAKALCNEVGVDTLFINGSEESNIDTLRGKIKQFASTVSLQGGQKVVILDEADYLNPNSFQPALRGFIEEFSNNCRFILTCNFKNKIIEPLWSRMAVYEFNTTKDVLADLAKDFYVRLAHILKTEGIKYDSNELATLILKYVPDWRRIINECQRYSTSGTLEFGLLNAAQDNYIELFGLLKGKEFKAMRAWCASNMTTDAASIFRAIYDLSAEYVAPASVPQLILILADYQYKNAFVGDHELNMVACLTEIMRDVEFK